MSDGSSARLVVPAGYSLRTQGAKTELLDTTGKALVSSSAESQVPGAVVPDAAVKSLISNTSSCVSPYFLVTPPDLREIQQKLAADKTAGG